MHRYNIDVAVITETHLDRNIPDEQIEQTGYKTIRRDRNFSAVNKSKGGGLILYMKNGMQYVEPRVRVPDDLEVCWCVLEPSRPNSIIVAGVYLPPNAHAMQRRMLADHLIETVDFLRSLRPKACTVLMGDFNNVFDVRSLTKQLSLHQIVTEPTRDASILDIIVTDINSQNMPIIAPAVGTSDHKTVLWINSDTKHKTYECRTVRPMKESCIRRFGQWICEQDWHDIIGIKDIDQAAELLEERLLTAYEHFFPLISYKCKMDEPPWITKRLKELIKRRNRAQSRHQYDKLKRLRESVRDEIVSAKERWYKRQMKKLHLIKMQAGIGKLQN